jgi:peptidoglycan/xylan/chitin deacetylase (PgdA/CDA1 family)
MRLLHNIGNENHSNYNTREEVLRCNDELGFDGVYYNVFQNKDVLKDKKGILFVMGDYIGMDNTFDLANVPKLERYCTLKEVEQLCEEYDFEVGWHTWTHRDLTTLSKSEIMKELTPPTPMDYLAYPHGTYNDLVVECAREVGYKKAWSVTQGNSNPLTLYRNYI